MGPSESEPVVYHWELMWTLARLAPLLVLVLLLLRPANHRWQAWTILPLTLAYAVGLAMAGAGGVDLDPSGFLLDGLVVFVLGLGLSWALLDLIAAGGRRGAFFIAVVVLGAASVFSAVCAACLEPFQAIQYAVVACMGGMAYLLAMLMGGVGCRKGYRPRRFVRWYGVTLLVTPFLIALPFFLISALPMIALIGFGEVLGALGWIAAMSLGAGTAMLVLTLPYLWIGLGSPSHRERLAAIYGIPGLAILGDLELATCAGSGNPGTPTEEGER